MMPQVKPDGGPQAFDQTLNALKAEAAGSQEAARLAAEQANDITLQGSQPYVLPPDGVAWTTESMMTLSLSVLVFGVITYILITYLIRIGKGPELVLRAFGVPLIIVAAVFLVVAGYTEQQIAPVIGLLGTIAGYLLGKSEPGATGGGTA
jgi:hypothetical protein